MVEHCTCGAQMVEGARFCHKCGRPLYDEPLAVETEAADVPAPVVPPVAGPPLPEKVTEISFRNLIAVRVGFMAAGLSLFAMQIAGMIGITLVQVAALLVLPILSGFFAVWLYRRRTGHSLSVKGGARLGWITGVFSFLIFLVTIAAIVGVVGIDEILRLQREQALARSMPSAEVEALLSNSSALVAILLAGLATMFATYSIAASVGGAVGAKMLDRREAS